MSYGLGLKTIKRLCQEQKPLEWYRAKLSPTLFSAYEQPLFEWVNQHLKNHHVLPQVETLLQQFPDLNSFEVVEPSSFYIKHLENQFYYKRIDKAILTTNSILKENQEDHEKAVIELQKAIKEIQHQKYRSRLLDVGVEAPEIVISNYHSPIEQLALFGWPYMDAQSGGVQPGEIVSEVGRPAAGKSWLMLWTSLENWKRKGNKKGNNVLFASMEITILPIAQRITSLYSGSTIAQLKNNAFSQPTYLKFAQSMKSMVYEDAKFYVIDGNLATNMDEIFVLADMLQCKVVIIDGAYLVQHENKRLDRFTRAAENVELMKRYVTDLQSVGFASWQFNRKASEKKGKQGGNESVGVEDIGYSDAIGQTSSIVLGLFQEEGVETLKSRQIRVLKGRNGETGQFTINWDFNKMCFKQIEPAVNGEPEECNQLQFI